ncbi:MAG: hypothetical protein IJB02_02820 [Oscillospiraceae bacterium]|nr:hypothetical protein [Oscillospiraceae bacterium]
MAKIERKYLAHFINAAQPGQEAEYERLGKDLEEFSPELSAQVETRKNILGQTSVVISGYEKTAAVEPFYAVAGSSLFDRLQAIIDDGKVLEELKADVVEVKLWEEETEAGFPAILEEVYIEVTSYGGDTTGYQIPFTLHYTGSKVKGRFQLESRIFTAD